jgi:hypothetical protein
VSRRGRVVVPLSRDVIGLPRFAVETVFIPLRGMRNKKPPPGFIPHPDSVTESWIDNRKIQNRVRH